MADYDNNEDVIQNNAVTLYWDDETNGIVYVVWGKTLRGIPATQWQRKKHRTHDWDVCGGDAVDWDRLYLVRKAPKPPFSVNGLPYYAKLSDNSVILDAEEAEKYAEHLEWYTVQGAWRPMSSAYDAERASRWPMRVRAKWG